MRRWTDELRRGDQVANLHRSGMERIKVVLDVLRWMGDHDRLIMITDDAYGLLFDRPVIEAAMEEGRLVTLPSRTTMLAGGHFDPEAFIGIILDQMSRSMDEGYVHTVIMWETDWAADHEAWSDIAGFGSRLALVEIPGRPTIIMQYDTTLHSDRQMDEVRRSTQLVLESGMLDRRFWVVSTPIPYGLLASAVGPSGVEMNQHR